MAIKETFYLFNLALLLVGCASTSRVPSSHKEEKLTCWNRDPEGTFHLDLQLQDDGNYSGTISEGFKPRVIYDGRFDLTVLTELRIPFVSMNPDSCIATFTGNEEDSLRGKNVDKPRLYIIGGGKEHRSVLVLRDGERPFDLNCTVPESVRQAVSACTPSGRSN